MKEITLNNGDVTIVDDDDYEFLKKFNWGLNTGGYAKRAIVELKNKTKISTVTMHRDVMKLKSGNGLQVDHINTNKLDNRKINLRICTQAENVINRTLFKNNKSGLKGVSWKSDSKKWCANICRDGKQKYLGVFSTKDAAHAAYCKAADEIHGEFANHGAK